jgi:hypothetical protein
MECHCTGRHYIESHFTLCHSNECNSSVFLLNVTLLSFNWVPFDLVSFNWVPFDLVSFYFWHCTECNLNLCLSSVFLQSVTQMSVILMSVIIMNAILRSVILLNIILLKTNYWLSFNLMSFCYLSYYQMWGGPRIDYQYLFHWKCPWKISLCFNSHSQNSPDRFVPGDNNFYQVKRANLPCVARRQRGRLFFIKMWRVVISKRSCIIRLTGFYQRHPQ